MIFIFNGGMNNDRVYFFFDFEFDNIIFCIYCFSLNFLNLNMFLFFFKIIVNEIFFKIY